MNIRYSKSLEIGIGAGDIFRLERTQGLLDKMLYVSFGFNGDQMSEPNVIRRPMTENDLKKIRAVIDIYLGGE